MARSALFTAVFLAACCGVASAADPLFTRLGGSEKIQAVVNDAVESAAQTGAAIGDPSAARQRLAQLICARTGGGCPSQAGGAEFAALLEPLRIALRAHDVPLAARNELIEALAPSRRDLAQR